MFFPLSCVGSPLRGSFLAHIFRARVRVLTANHMLHTHTQPKHMDNNRENHVTSHFLHRTEWVWCSTYVIRGKKNLPSDRHNANKTNGRKWTPEDVVTHQRSTVVRWQFQMRHGMGWALEDRLVAIWSPELEICCCGTSRRRFEVPQGRIAPKASGMPLSRFNGTQCQCRHVVEVTTRADSTANRKINFLCETKIWTCFDPVAQEEK